MTESTNSQTNTSPRLNDLERTVQEEGLKLFKKRSKLSLGVGMAGTASIARNIKSEDKADQSALERGERYMNKITQDSLDKGKGGANSQTGEVDLSSGDDEMILADDIHITENHYHGPPENSEEASTVEKVGDVVGTAAKVAATGISPWWLALPLAATIGLGGLQVWDMLKPEPAPVVNPQDTDTTSSIRFTDEPRTKLSEE